MMPDGSRGTVDGGVVGFFSLEMSAEQLATRIIAERTGILGAVVASLSVAMYVEDVEVGLRHLAPPVIQAANRVSTALGWRP